ncbi:MAG: SDR family oxidoreductase [Verrucomicrobiales bacterium]|jgi:3-oxoacyl-[acyl-carrier protein] reductase|nr:SDR family oxidoreductase [Verrucomicrobiales bacterium]MDF1787286.1 SDR family NAD(P)-dependent oxidoreductase [Verrucomicrobiales bacterium]
MNTLITGANGGLGIALAERFLENADHHVWLGVRANRNRAEALAQMHGDRVRLVDLDVTSEDDWAQAVESMVQADQSPDVLINNAGFHKDGLLAMMPTEDWHSVIQANLDAVYLGCRAVLKPMMGNRFGRIINIASLSALLAPRGQTNYAAAKAGVVALTQSLSKEMARAGITVNALCPGYIDTEALVDMPEAERKSILSTIPMRRLGKPGEVAAAAAFLASQEASYITGAALKIDGGIF